MLVILVVIVILLAVPTKVLVRAVGSTVLACAFIKHSLIVRSIHKEYRKGTTDDIHFGHKLVEAQRAAEKRIKYIDNHYFKESIC